MKEKVITIVMCLVAFLTLCAVIDSPFQEVPNDPDGNVWPMCIAFFCVLTMVLGPVFKPLVMILCLIAGTVTAIYCGTMAFAAYAVCAACISSMVRFNPQVQDMIRSLWKADEE